jgi:hypothetical protein
VELNGAWIQQLELPVSLNPGRYHLEVSAPGKQSHREELDLTEGLVLQIALPELSDTLAEQPSTAVTDALASASTPRTPRFGAAPLWFGGAAAFFGGAWLYTGLMSSAKNAEYSKLVDRCSVARCDEATLRDARGTRNTAKSFAVATDRLIIPIFGATLGTAVLLWWLDDFALPGAAEPAQGATAHVQLGCAPGSCAVAYEGRF